MTELLNKYHVGQKVLYTGRTNQCEEVKNAHGTIININYTNKNLQVKLDESNANFGTEHVAHVPVWSMQVPIKEGRKEIEVLF